MGTRSQQLIKQREIGFCVLHPNASQARSAALLLTDVDGVVDTRALTDTLIEIRYDLFAICLEDIDGLLIELGYHLNNQLLHRMRRSLHYFTEDTERANCGYSHENSNNTREVFISRYRHLQHGCRDQRPEHWRRYL